MNPLGIKGDIVHRSRQLLTALAAVLAALFVATAPAVSASATQDPGQKWVQDSIHAQLERKPGGTVHDNSVTYAAENITMTYIPKSASPTSPVVRYDNYGTCGYGWVCLYSDGYLGTQVLTTSSIWCPAEGTRQSLYFSDYGISGNVRSEDNVTGWYTAVYWDNGWNTGIQWQVGPWGNTTGRSASNVYRLNVCAKYGDVPAW